MGGISELLARANRENRRKSEHLGWWSQAESNSQPLDCDARTSPAACVACRSLVVPGGYEPKSTRARGCPRMGRQYGLTGLRLSVSARHWLYRGEFPVPVSIGRAEPADRHRLRAVIKGRKGQHLKLQLRSLR